MREALEVWDRDWRLRPRNFIDVTTVRYIIYFMI
jgi:hypothetical protein